MVGGCVADLVTHLCVVLLPAAWLPRRWVAPLAIGAAMPDAAGRVPGLAAEAVMQLGLAVPDAWVRPFGVAHTPLGAVAITLWLVAFARPVDRSLAGAALTLGAASHFVLDVLQDHHGEGYLLLWPWSMEQLELGWIGAQATTPVALPLLAVTAAAWGWRAKRQRVARRSRPPAS